MSEHKGLTLLELLISIAIIAMIAAIVSPYLFPQQKVISLDGQAEEISNYLELAQARATGTSNDQSWGVHFENPSSGDNYFEIYSTATDYSQAVVDTTLYLNWGIKFSYPSVGNNLTIQFAKGAGTTTSNSVSIISSDGHSQTISVNSEGVVSVTKD